MNAALGHTFRFGYFDETPIDRMKAIRRAGFGEVMLWWGDEHASTDGTPEAQHRLALSQGLAVKTAHFPFANAHHLWLPGEEGQRQESALLGAVEALSAHQIGHMVVHVTFKRLTPPPNALGVARMGRVLDLAQRLGVTIALENTRSLAHLKCLFDALPSPRLGLCYDSGHAHCFTPDQDPLELFGHKLCTTHLHDNHGPQAGDEHLPIGDGTAAFDAVFKKLAALGPVSYNLESYQSPALGEMTMDQYLARGFRRLIRCLVPDDGVSPGSANNDLKESQP